MLLKRCSCLSQLIKVKHKGVYCNDNFTIHRKRRQWLLATYKHSDRQHHGVIIHDFCPYDYCRDDTQNLLSLDLEFPDDRCAFNSSNILCGAACQQSFSQVLGTSRCLKC